jgi:hypothetical protein
MKKFLFSLFTAAFSLTYLSAQQMSYYPNMVGSPGQSFVIANDDTIYASDMDFNTGTVGAGSVWNFQGLDQDGLDTLHFLSLTAQEATDFPSGNLVIESNVGRIVFDKDAPTGLFLQGTNADFQGIGLSLNYTPPQQTLPAVASLGSTAHTISYVDEIVFTGIDTNVLGCQVNIDSIQLKRTSDYTVTFPATGELRLPLDTFTYTLMSIATERTLDSIFIYSATGISGGTCPGFGLSAPIGWSLAPNTLIVLSGFASGSVVVDSAFTASWYDPYTISPVCIVDFTYDSAYLDTNFLGFRFKALNTPDIGFEEVDQIDLNVYPNPASSLLMLQTDAILTDATMYIYNAQGQQVRALNLNGSNSVDVSALNNGMYFYQLANGTKLLHQGKFVIKK